MMNTLCTCVLPLDLAIHISFMFVIEGQKTMLRIIYSILHLTKPFFMKLQDKKDLIGKMREFCKDISIDDIVKKAYEVQMSTTGPLTNLKFNTNADKVKQKQALASHQKALK